MFGMMFADINRFASIFLISAGKRNARQGSWAVFGSVELKKIAEDFFFFCILIHFYFVLQKVRALHTVKK